MGDLFTVKSKMLLFQAVMDQEQFQHLPAADQVSIIKNYQKLRSKLESPFFDKLTNSLKQLLFKIPPFEMAWLFFSVVISIQLLMRIEGAAQVIWLLPLLAGVYTVDNRLSSNPPQTTEAELLFPSETFIVERYLKEPLSENIFEQQEQLKRGFELYLIDKWDPNHLKANEGQFYFNLERLKKTMNEKPSPFPKREPTFFLALYLFWNLSYALVATQIVHKRQKNDLKDKRDQNDVDFVL